MSIAAKTTRIRNKAVAEGAIIFQIDHSVSSRVARYTYGIQMNTTFDRSLADHLAREDTCFESYSGEIKVPNRFSSILQKVNFTPLCYVSADLQQDTEVSEETQFRASYRIILSKSGFRALSTYSVEIKCYRNRRENAPDWVDIDPCV